VTHIKKIVSILLTAALGLIFLYSGYSKLLPVIETFEFTFVDLGVANWYTAPVIARLLIGSEIFIGVLLVLHYNLKKFTLPFTAGLLLFFIIYLTIQIMISGNEGNCGCFGEHLRMTPMEAIIKNQVILAATTAVYFMSAGWRLSKFHGLFSSLVFAGAITVTFVLNPVDFTYTSNNLDEKVNYPLELNLLYEPTDTTKVEIPSVDLRRGKHVVAFVSLTCSHCRVAAKKFRLIKKNNPSLPIYFILNGDKERYADFIKDTKASNIPSSYCLGKSFIQLASSRLPRIYYLDNGIVVKKVDYFELNQYDIEKWLEEK
jgi:hypothetical protein